MCEEKVLGVFVLCVCRLYVCLCFSNPKDDAVSSLNTTFHSLHASVSGQRIHNVSICLKSICSPHWKVCISEHIFIGVHPGEHRVPVAHI